MARASLVRGSWFQALTCGPTKLGNTVGMPSGREIDSVSQQGSFAFTEQRSRLEVFFPNCVKKCRNFRVPAFKIVNSIDRPPSRRRQQSRVPETLKQGPEEGGLSIGEPCNLEYKTCSECQRSKLLCDFKANRSNRGKRTDICRACLARMTAVRMGRKLYHLELSVEEAWERARVCSMCGHRKELGDFNRNNTRKDFLGLRCRSCKSAYTPLRVDKPVETKVCTRCNQLKLANEFPLSSRDRTGLNSFCTKCHMEYEKERKEKVRAAGVVRRGPVKLCGCCEVLKPMRDFYNDCVSIDGLRPLCKKCYSELG